MRALSVLIVCVALTFAPRPCTAQLGHHKLGGTAAFRYVTWDVSHEKEDGTGDDICIMEGTFPGVAGEFAIRKNVTQSFYKQRIWAPGFNFTYGVAQHVWTLFALPPAVKTWEGDGSGVGQVYDVNTPKGPAFDDYLGQMFSASRVGAIDGSLSWAMPLGGADKAFAVLQDCVSSATVGDGRW